MSVGVKRGPGQSPVKASGRCGATTADAEQAAVPNVPCCCLSHDYVANVRTRACDRLRSSAQPCEARLCAAARCMEKVYLQYTLTLDRRRGQRAKITIRHETTPYALPAQNCSEASRMYGMKTML
eukprot:353762-Chlamydomonas_euryale.AAC.6